MVSEKINPENKGDEPPSVTPQEVAEEEMEFQPPLKQPKPASSISIGGGIGKTALVSLVVAVLVMILMGMMGGGSFVTKKDFETNMANMAVSVNDATASVNTSLASVNSAIQGLPNTVSSTVNTAISQQTSDINKSISQMSASVSSLSADVSALSTKMDKNMVTLDEKITEIQTQMEDYDTRITDLETVKEEEEEVKATKKLDAVKVKTGYSSTFEFPGGKDPSVYTTGDITLYFQVDNTTDYDIENVRIELVLHSRGIPINLTSSLCKVSGGWPLHWQKVYVGNGVFVITGITPTYGSGLEIDADDDVAVFVTVSLGVPVGTIIDEDVTFYVEGKVTGYDIIE